MPGYQPVRIVQPTNIFAKNEPIYGPLKMKKKGKGSHALFDELKSRDMRDRMSYDRFLKSQEMVKTDPSGQRSDSLKFIASCNDLTYLESVMSMPRQRIASSNDEQSDSRPRSRGIVKSPTAVLGKGDKRNSPHTDSNAAVTVAMLSSLRSSASEDNLYESVEMIHYLKTIQSLNRQKKTRSIQKTGHPLFDSLREEQAMKEPIRKISTSKKLLDEQVLQGLRNNEYTTSDGCSPSQSSSSSGDEYDIYPRIAVKNTKNSRSRGALNIPQRKISEPLMRYHEMPKPNPKKKQSGNSSESDDEFKIIPRPRLVGGRGFLMTSPQQQQPKQRRRSDASPPSDESDSSNSAILR